MTHTPETTTAPSTDTDPIRIPARVHVPDDDDLTGNAPTLASTLLEAIADERAAAYRKQRLFRALVAAAGGAAQAGKLIGMTESGVRHHIGKGSHRPRHKR